MTVTEAGSPAEEVPPKDVPHTGTVMEELKYYTEERDKLLKFSLYSSGISLLLAATSRIPTWEVSSPVAFLVGSLNVGFLSILGPIFTFGTFAYALQWRSRVADLRRALLADSRFDAEFGQAAVENSLAATPKLARRRSILRSAGGFWLVAIPILAYTILLCSFFDLTRPAKDHPDQYQYPTRTGQIADLLLGTGGWSGFAPLAPSIHDNLKRLADEQAEAKERARLTRLAQQMPWIYPPFQTWAYVGGLLLMLWLAWGIRSEGRM